MFFGFHMQKTAAMFALSNDKTRVLHAAGN